MKTISKMLSYLTEFKWGWYNGSDCIVLDFCTYCIHWFYNYEKIGCFIERNPKRVNYITETKRKMISVM